jgi:hypothetical protein
MHTDKAIGASRSSRPPGETTGRRMLINKCCGTQRKNLQSQLCIGHMCNSPSLCIVHATQPITRCATMCASVVQDLNW